MSNFTRFPVVEIDGDALVLEGWEDISAEILNRLSTLKGERITVVVEFYQGVLEEDVTPSLSGLLESGLG